MDIFFDSLINVALLAVLVVLGLGLWNMLRGDNPNRSQKLMRLRVIFQLIAIIVVMVSFYFAS